MDQTGAPPNLHQVNSPDQFRDLLSKDLTRVSLINFWAPWAEPCQQMNQVVAELAKKYQQLLVLEVEAEEQPDITESFDIEAVPSFIVLRGHTLLTRISGADAQTLTSAIATHLHVSPSGPPPVAAPPEETQEELEARMRKLMGQSKVVLFMKGDPSKPRCGFSSRAVALLERENVKFTHFDILSDEKIRQGLKKHNNWPTFPQFTVDGEFIGGLDVVTEMVENGEFADVVGAA